DPPLADQPIWSWRWKDGQVERAAHQLLALNSSGQLTEARTDADGVYHSGNIVIPDGSYCGIYANEQFAVGSPYSLRSENRTFRISCVGKTLPGGPVAKRPDGHFPHYQLGDTATLEIVTDPPQPHAPVYTWRTKDGVADRIGEPLTLYDVWGNGSPAITDGDGRLVYSATLDDAGACGSYTEERFSVGSTAAQASGALSYVVYCPNAQPPQVTRPDAAFPTYHLGDMAALRISTDPPQPNQRIYGWRLKDGESERSAEPMMRDDGAGGLVPWRTDAAGVFEIADVELVGEASCGSYTLEQFTVGDARGPKSSPLAFEVQCPLPPQAPNVTRPDGNYPSYHLGDRAALSITTWPAQPFQQVYGWRIKDGFVERDGEPVYYQEDGVGIPMITDASGRFL
ncbi:MAG: hypothetical protein AAFY88_28710, partial [Acidobacteriota bacterium]